MDEPKVDIAPPLVKQPSQWIVAATCSALVMVMTAGGIFAMRDRLIADVQNSTQEHKAAIDAVEQRMDRLQSSINALEAAPKLDTDTIHSIQSDLTEVKSSIEALQKHGDSIEARIKTLEEAAIKEKEVVEKVSASAASANATELKMTALSGKPYVEQWNIWSTKHPREAAKYTHLQSFAATGIPLETDMRSSMRNALKDAKIPAKVDDTSFIGKINTHLHGLVSIKKSSDSDVLSGLRMTAERDDLETAVKALEASGALESSKALSDWHSDYLGRKQALAELSSFGSAAELPHD